MNGSGNDDDTQRQPLSRTAPGRSGATMSDWATDDDGNTVSRVSSDLQQQQYQEQRARPFLFNLLFGGGGDGGHTNSNINGTTMHLGPTFDQYATSTTSSPGAPSLHNLTAADADSTFGNASTSTIATSLSNGDADIGTLAGYLLAGVLVVLIVVTIIGNTLIILAVITTRRLRTVTNCFVMSLAVADWMVGTFVMPPAVAVHLIGSWQLGWWLCDIWISLDVLLCTASILSLCAISIDRYLAVTQPLAYSRRRRSKRLAMSMILVVWVLALIISCPPFFGWYEPGRRDLHECRYNQNEGYVIFSAMGSFFIPMAVMLYVYLRISCVVAKRHDHMHEIEMHKPGQHNHHQRPDADGHHSVDFDPDPSSEQDFPSPYRRRDGGSSSDQALPSSSSTAQSTPLCVGLRPPHRPVRNGQYEQVSITADSTPTMPPTPTPLPPAASRNNRPHQFEQHQFQTIVLHVDTTTSSLIITENPQAQPPPATARSTPRANVPKCVQHRSATATIRAHPPQQQQQPQKRQQPQHTKSMSHRITPMKREKKTTQTLSIVVGGFIVCWLPFFVYYLLTPFLPHEHVSGNVTNCLTWLGWFNSAMNPFIYAFYSIDFRAAFWRLTFQRVCSGSFRAPYSSNAMSIRVK